MKTLFKTLLIAFILSSCSQDDPQPVADSPLLNTTWQAPDEIADIIFSGANYQVLEFITNTEVQYYKMQSGTAKNQKIGAFVFEAPTLTITFDDAVRTFEVTGSLMVSNEQRLSTGGYLTYSKQ